MDENGADGAAPGRVDAWWSVTHRPAEVAEPVQPADDAPRTRSGRPARAARPAALPPARAFAGAAVAVAGVALGIGTLLWATDAPQGDPVVTAGPAAGSSVDAGLDMPAVEPPEGLDGPAQPNPVSGAGVDGGAAAASSVPVEPAPAAAPPVPVEPPPAAAPPAAPAGTAPAPDRLVVPVLVLNNSRIDGLAARSAARFEAGGWPVRDIGSLRGRIRATTVYYPPGQEASAREFARRFDGVRRVLPRLETLPGTGLTVVVTRDFPR